MAIVQIQRQFAAAALVVTDVDEAFHNITKDAKEKEVIEKYGHDSERPLVALRLEAAKHRLCDHLSASNMITMKPQGSWQNIRFCKEQPWGKGARSRPYGYPFGLFPCLYHEWVLITLGSVFDTIIARHLLPGWWLQTQARYAGKPCTVHQALRQLAEQIDKQSHDIPLMPSKDCVHPVNSSINVLNCADAADVSTRMVAREPIGESNDYFVVGTPENSWKLVFIRFDGTTLDMWFSV